MDKKDEVNEEVHYSDVKKFQHDYSGKNSQADSENEDNVLRKITQTDIENDDNYLRKNSQTIDRLVKKSQTNDDNCLRKDSQAIGQIDSLRKKQQTNNEIDALRKDSQTENENEILRIVKTLSKDDESSKKETINKTYNENNDNRLRKNSQAIDKANTFRNLEIQNKENNTRNIETKNKGNVIKIDVNHTQSKSNVKSIYKQDDNYQVKRNQIKTINKKQQFKKPDYWGHRERLRNRFREGLLKGFTDYEVLELLLFYTINKIDTKPIAYNLINEFGSIEKVFTQTYERILSVIQKDIRPSKQECEKSAFLIKFIRNLAVLLWNRGINNRLKAKEKIIKNGSELLTYLKEQYNNYLEADMRDLSFEQFRVIFLDSRNKILKDEVMFEGTINQTGVYPRQILKRALELNATAIIAVHNHPGGTLKPSNADISVTRTLQSACDNLGISLLDHLIIGDKFCNGEDQEKSFYSFAENGLL